MIALQLVTIVLLILVLAKRSPETQDQELIDEIYDKVSSIEEQIKNIIK